MKPVLVFDQASVARLSRNLTLLPRRVDIKHVRIGLNAWGGVVKDVAVARAPRDTKLLAKSLIVKVIIPDASFNSAHHGRPARALVGASRSAVAPVIRKGGKTKTLSIRKATRLVLGGGRVGVRKASRYAHLANRKSRYMEAAQAAGATAGMEKLRQKIDQGITQEVAALRTK